MTRSELIRKISQENPHLASREIGKIVKTVFETISEALSQGKRIELRGFGVFSLRVRPPRISRNPRTGAPVRTESKKVLHFRAGKKMAEYLNSNYK